MSIVGKEVEFIFSDGDRIQGVVIDLLSVSDYGAVLVRMDDNECKVVNLYQFHCDMGGSMRILGAQSCR